MKQHNRRKFITLSALTIASVAAQRCSRKKENTHSEDKGGRTAYKGEDDPSKGMSREAIMLMLDQRAGQYIRQSGNCAQSSFKALSEQFGLENRAILKALTPLPGMAETGKTCGVVTGCLMCMGLIYGRDNLDDWQKYRDSLIPTGKFVREFETEQGSLSCSDIVEKEFGKRLDLLNPGDRQEFVAGDPAVKCGNVVKKGLHIAANIILDSRDKV